MTREVAETVPGTARSFMRRHHPLTTFSIAILLAFAFAVEWVVVMTITLPRTDLAHGQSPFQDPLVFPVMSVLASIAGVVTFPFLHFAVRDRELRQAVPILAGTVALAILVLTPLNAGVGFAGSFVAYGVGLWIARRCAGLLVLPGHCTRCGYDRRIGPTTGRCPECGNP